MRSKLLLLAIVLVTATTPNYVHAQDVESRIAAIAMALAEVRRALPPGTVNVHLPPQSLRSSEISREEGVGAAKRVGYSVSEDSTGIAGHPAAIHLRLESATIEPDFAKILVAIAIKKPAGGYLTGRTDAVILTRVDGQWHVKDSHLNTVQ